MSVLEVGRGRRRSAITNAPSRAEFFCAWLGWPPPAQR